MQSTPLHGTARRKRIGLIAVVTIPLVVALVGCSSPEPEIVAADSLIDAERCAANQDAGTITYVNTFGFGSIQLLTALDKGWYEDLCLDVQTVTDTTTSAQIVSAGTAQITQVGAASNAIELASGGSNLTAIATSAYTSVFTLLTEPGITDLSELEGQTVGFHTTIPAPITQMLLADGVDVDSIEWINDNTYNPVLVTTGQFDAIQAYKSNEPLALERQGLDFNQFDPEDYGVTGTTNVWLANTDFIEEHPTAVQDFMLATFHAQEYCAEEIDECVDIVGALAEEAGQDYDTAHQAESWLIVYDLMENFTLEGKGIGQQTAASWQDELDSLIESGLVTEADAPDLDTLVNSDIVDGIYDGETLLWPGN